MIFQRHGASSKAYLIPSHSYYDFQLFIATEYDFLSSKPTHVSSHSHSTTFFPSISFTTALLQSLTSNGSLTLLTLPVLTQDLHAHF